MSRADKRRRQKEGTRAAREAREAARRRHRRRSIVVRVVVAVLVVAAALGVGALLTDDDGDETAADASSTTTAPATTTTDGAFQIDPTKTYAFFTVTLPGPRDEFIVAELDIVNAPQAANHFIELVNEGFYNGTKFHRASTDFVIQGGDPTGTGTGGSGRSIVGELPADGYPIGSLAAAKTGTDPAGTFDSQFFIVTGSRPLENVYARFGKVVDGLGVAQEIEALAPASGDGPPTQDVVVKQVDIVDPGDSLPTSTTTPTTSGAS
jgi:peptidyl-prolyl cis-trans isomerase B (cyclophilin B)